MIGFLLAATAYVRAYVVSRHRLGLEAAALRQQLIVLKRNRPRPPLRNVDRLFWVALRRLWTGWARALIIVKAETVVSWHRAGFRLFWRLRSRPLGRPKIDHEMRALPNLTTIIEDLDAVRQGVRKKVQRGVIYPTVRVTRSISLFHVSPDRCETRKRVCLPTRPRRRHSQVMHSALLNASLLGASPAFARSR